MAMIRKYKREDTTTSADYACGQQQVACLASGHSKPICDDGVQECMYRSSMSPVLYSKATPTSRYGFSDQSPFVWVMSVVVILLIVGALLFMYMSRK